MQEHRFSAFLHQFPDLYRRPGLKPGRIQMKRDARKAPPAPVHLFPIFIVFSNQIAFLFSYSANSSSLAPTISYILNFVWLFIIPVAFGATASYAFQGMGKGITSFLLTMQREAILVIIFTFILGISLSLGVRGVYYGLVIGNAIGSAVGLLCIEIFISRLLKKANS